MSGNSGKGSVPNASHKDKSTNESHIKSYKYGHLFSFSDYYSDFANLLGALKDNECKEIFLLTLNRLR